MDWIINLLPGGWLSVIGAGVVAAVGLGVKLRSSAHKSGYNQRVVEEGKANAEEMERIRRAADATRIPTDVRTDPNNRDNWKK